MILQKFYKLISSLSLKLRLGLQLRLCLLKYKLPNVNVISNKPPSTDNLFQDYDKVIVNDEEVYQARKSSKLIFKYIAILFFLPYMSYAFYRIFHVMWDIKGDTSIQLMILKSVYCSYYILVIMAIIAAIHRIVAIVKQRKSINVIMIKVNLNKITDKITKLFNEHQKLKAISPAEIDFYEKNITTLEVLTKEILHNHNLITDRFQTIDEDKANQITQRFTALKPYQALYNKLQYHHDIQDYKDEIQKNRNEIKQKLDELKRYPVNNTDIADMLHDQLEILNKKYNCVLNYEQVFLEKNEISTDRTVIVEHYKHLLEEYKNLLEQVVWQCSVFKEQNKEHQEDLGMISSQTNTIDSIIYNKHDKINSLEGRMAKISC